jgi:hypothetical protein
LFRKTTADNGIRRTLQTLHAFNKNHQEYEKPTLWWLFSQLKGSVANLKRCTTSSTTTTALDLLITTGGVVHFDHNATQVMKVFYEAYDAPDIDFPVTSVLFGRPSIAGYIHKANLQ